MIIRTNARGRILIPALLVGLSLTACGGESAKVGQPSKITASAENTNGFNKADTTFLHDMIPHHAQAVDLSALVESRTKNSDIAILAKKIAAAQEPEIGQMKALLKASGEPLPKEDGMNHSGMDSGDMNHSEMGDDQPTMQMMPGMVSDADLAKLSASRNRDFDTLWLTFMIAHHNGALTMADTVITSGKNSATKNLAGQIKTSQTTEIATMEKLLGS